MSPFSFSAVLLAGGKSRRMGRSKAHLDVAGTPLWQLQIKKLQALQPAQLFISSSEPFPSGPWLVIGDQRADCGPLGGLEAALLTCGDRPLLVLSVDTPGITVDLLGQLLAGATSKKGIVPQLKIYFEEVVVGDPFIGNVAIYPPAILPIVQQALESDDRSFQSVIRRAIPELLSIWDVPKYAEPQFQNVNTPEDFQRFLNKMAIVNRPIA